MKKSAKLLSMVLALAMLLSLGSVSLAADGDWAEYQQYVISYAVAGAPTEADAESMSDMILACADMDDIAACADIQVFFEVLGALDFDAWVAAGKPDADMAGSASGEADASGEASGEAGENAVVSVSDTEVVYISDGEELTAAIGEGQYAYLSVDGVNIPLAEGSYDGTVVIDVVDPIFESSDYQTGDKDVNLSTELASVIYLTEDGLQEGQSILGAAVDGEITDTSVSGVTIRSEEAGVSGIRAGGSGEIEVSDVTIELTGVGGNDFMGQGAALCATDGAHLIARNVTATVSGFVRGCTFAGGQATLEVYDSTFYCDAGEFDSTGSAEGAGMSQPPNGLGVYGNARSNNLVHYATEYFENCVFVNRNWGCLGVDAVSDGTLTCVDCSITVTESGYGAYSIGPCVDTFTNCTFDITNGVVAFIAVEGTVILDGGTVANSDRYGLVTHQAMGAVSTLKVLGEGTELNTAKCGIMVKGRSSDIEIGDGAIVTASETGILVQAQDNDDTGAGSVNDNALVSVDIHDTALEGDIVMSMAPADGSDATMAVVLNNAELTGAMSLSNSDLFISDGSIGLDNVLSVGLITNHYGAREDACYLTVELENGAVWNVTETSYVTELTVDDSSVVNGVITEVDGGYVVSPAEGGVEEASAAEAGSLTINVNGQPIAVTGVDVSANADGSFSFDLSGLVEALGIELSYDEASGVATVRDVSETGLFSALIGTLLGDIPAAEEPAEAEAPASAEPAASEEPAAAADGDASEDGYKAYLKAFVDAVPANDGVEEEFYAVIDAGSYYDFPMEIGFSGYWGEIPMTYEEFAAAGGVYTIPDLSGVQAD